MRGPQMMVLLSSVLLYAALHLFPLVFFSFYVATALKLKGKIKIANVAPNNKWLGAQILTYSCGDSGEDDKKDGGMDVVLMEILLCTFFFKCRMDLKRFFFFVSRYYFV